MKLYISTDFEGVAGIVDWDQVTKTSSDYAQGRSLFLGELRAAIRGAMEVGTTEITVNDGHADMRNIGPEDLDPDIRLITGRFKPLNMMQGIDASFDAVFFVGYHGSIGAPGATLSHTYSRAIWEARIDGQVTGEAGLNALVARHYGVPIALVTGDSAAAREAKNLFPGVTTVSVKDSCSRFGANNLSPSKAQDLIYQGARAALASVPPSPPDGPVRIDLTFQSHDMAGMAEAVKHVEISGERSITADCPDGLSAYRTFYGILQMVSPLVGS